MSPDEQSQSLLTGISRVLLRKTHGIPAILGRGARLVLNSFSQNVIQHPCSSRASYCEVSGLGEGCRVHELCVSRWLSVYSSTPVAFSLMGALHTACFPRMRSSRLTVRFFSQRVPSRPDCADRTLQVKPGANPILPEHRTVTSSTFTS